MLCLSPMPLNRRPKVPNLPDPHRARPPAKRVRSPARNRHSPRPLRARCRRPWPRPRFSKADQRRRRCLRRRAALGGAEGERVSYTTASRWDHKRQHDPCVSSTELGFDRPKRMTPGIPMAVRSTITNANAGATDDRTAERSQLRVAQPKAFSWKPPVDIVIIEPHLSK